MTTPKKELEMRTRLGNSRFVAVVVTGLTLVALIGCGPGSSSSSGSGSIQSPTLLIADFYNNRVVIFDSPFSAGENATTALGQTDFTTSVQATTASGLAGPLNAVTDAQGNIWVSDVRNNRVLRYGPPFTNGMPANLVLGQMNFTAAGESTSMSGLSLPDGLVFDKSGNLWVADSYNARVLEFSPPFTSGMAASLALGQPPFSTGVCLPTSASTLCFPTGLTFDTEGDLWTITVKIAFWNSSLPL